MGCYLIMTTIITPSNLSHNYVIIWGLRTYMIPGSYQGPSVYRRNRYRYYGIVLGPTSCQHLDLGNSTLILDPLFSTSLNIFNVYPVYYVYRVSQEERTKLREGVPYVKLYRYNPKHLCPKLNGFRDNGKRSLKL